MSKKIKILENGPYIVSGEISLSEKNIVLDKKNYKLEEAQIFKTEALYSLCRCGKSENSPYCDGSHGKFDFDGTETASRASYAERATTCEGPELDLMDDGRCALARFCHRETGSAWQLAKKSDNPYLKAEAIKAAVECPAGRLVAVEKSGKPIEPEYEPAIEVLQDIEKNVGGPLFVKGNIPIEAADGFTYEVRNRVTLCRCGSSNDKPFCDGRHIKAKFKK